VRATRANVVQLDKQLEAYAEARGESVAKMVSGFSESLELRLAAAATDAPPARTVSEECAESSLSALPSNAELARMPSRLVVEVRTELLTIHAYTCDAFGEARAFVGVATFPGEAPDLRRQRTFVLLCMNHEPHFMTLDAFLRVFEGRSESERSFRIEGIQVRELPEGLACFVRMRPHDALN
jgi:hypothetical protein